MIISRFRNLFFVMLAAFCWQVRPCDAANEPLRVENGKFLLRGQPCTAYGINYFDAFSRMLGDTRTGAKISNQGYRSGFKILKANGIPFIRFMCGGFSPEGWYLYQTNPQQYFSLLDDFVAEAEKDGLGLVPSLFWLSYTVPALVGEPRNAWGDPNSKTIAFMREYVNQVVSRYRNSPAIWGWEFGNEIDLEADLPLDPSKPPAFFRPSPGKHEKWGLDDRLTSLIIRAAYQQFGKAVRAIDPVRPIFTGDAMPRASAFHLRENGTWGKDSPREWMEMLQYFNPDPVDTISIHFYQAEKGIENPYGLAGRSFEERLQGSLEVCKQTNKPLWVGEFGASEKVNPDEERSQFEEVLDILQRNHVQLAATWVFDFPGQPLLNITDQNEKSYMLKELGKANARSEMESK